MGSFRTFLVAVGLTVVWALIPGIPVGVVSADESKDIVAEAQSIRNTARPFKIELWTEEGKSAYAVGEKVNFLFKSEKDCYITLIDIGTSGKVTKLFPNKWHESNKVESGKTYRIPPVDSGFVFKVEGPDGMEFVKAIATLDPIKSIDRAEIKSKGNLEQFEKPRAVLKDISTELAQQDARRWSDADISFTIAGSVPQSAAVSEKPFKIKLSTDKTVYQSGDEIVFNFESDKDCDLVLIDIGSSGIVKIIFPNQYRTDNSIKANRVYRIPPEGVDKNFTYRVTSPRGMNTIKAIGTIKPCGLIPGNLPFRTQVYPELGDKSKVLKDISVELGKLDPKHFAETEITIEIK